MERKNSFPLASGLRGSLRRVKSMSTALLSSSPTSGIPIQTERLTLVQKQLICSKVKKDFIPLAKQLEIPENKIDNIVRTCIKPGSGTTPAQQEHICMEFINEWEKTHGNAASVKQMMKTLQKLGQSDIVSQIFLPQIKLRSLEKEIICHDIGRDCKKLGKLLLSKDCEVTALVKRCKATGDRFYRDLCFMVIEKWERDKQDKATKKEMINMLTRLPRMDIVSSIHSVKKFTRPFLNTELIVTQESIKNRLKGLYERIHLPLFPWLNCRDLSFENLYIDPELYLSVQYGRENMQLPIIINDLFDPSKAKEHSARILIEGDAGFGKTTLLLKIANNWSKGLGMVQRFRMTFYFYLRNCGEKHSIEDLIIDEYRKLQLDAQEGLMCVKAYEEEILFLLDGYDELRDDARPQFDSLLKRNQFSKSTVVITSRPGIVGAKYNELETKGLVSKKGDYDWDQKIVIKGLSKKNRHVFLRKFFDNDIPNDTFQRLSQWVDLDLFCCPLFLILTAALTDDMDIQSIDSQTLLYKCNLNAVTRRSLYRFQKIGGSDEIELFNPKSSDYHKESAEQIERFGELSLSHLISDRLSFQEDEIEECCGKDSILLQIGFINKHVTLKNREFDGFYEPIHKSILEFCAAFYLFRLATKSDAANNKEFKSVIGSLIEAKQDTQCLLNLFSFLVGLLDNNSTILLQALRPWRSLFNIFKKPLWNLITEINDLQAVLPSMKPFLPRYFEIDSEMSLSYRDRETFCQLFRFFCDYCNVDVINWDFYYSFELPIKTKTLILNFMQCYRISTRNTKSPSSVQCEDLFCHFSHLNMDLWNSVVDFVSSIETQNVYFYFYRSSVLLTHVHRQLTEGRWCNLKLQEITIHYFKEYDDPSLVLLDDLLKRKIILQGVHLIMDQCESNVNKAAILNILESSTHCLSAISLSILRPSYSSPVVNFNHLNKFDKKWSHFLFNNLFTYEYSDSESELVPSCPVENVQVEYSLDSQFSTRLMKFFSNAASLECRVGFLKNCFSDHCYSLLGIRKLCLHLDSVSFDFWQLHRLRHLHLLSLRFCNTFACRSLEIMVEDLCSFINRSNVDIFELDWYQCVSNDSENDACHSEPCSNRNKDTFFKIITTKIINSTRQKINFPYPPVFPIKQQVSEWEIKAIKDDSSNETHSNFQDQKTNNSESEVEAFVIALFQKLVPPSNPEGDIAIDTKVAFDLPTLRELRIRNSFLSSTLLFWAKQLLLSKAVQKLVLMDENEFVDFLTPWVFPPGENFSVFRQATEGNSERRTMIPYWKNEVSEKRHAWKMFPTLAVVYNDAKATPVLE